MTERYSFRFFTRVIPEEKALAYRSNSDFPVRKTPTIVSGSVLHYGNKFLIAEQSVYNIQTYRKKGKKLFPRLAGDVCSIASSTGEGDRGRKGSGQAGIPEGMMVRRTSSLPTIPTSRSPTTTGSV